MATPQTTPTPPSAGSGGRGRWVAPVVAVVGVVLVAAFAYYRDEISSALTLKPWNDSGPRAAVDAFGAALSANDVDAIQSLTARQLEIQVDETGKVAALKPAGAMVQPIAAGDVTPGEGAAAAEVKYDLRPNQRCARVRLRASSGNSLTLALVHRDGAWLVDAWTSIKPASS